MYTYFWFIYLCRTLLSEILKLLQQIYMAGECCKSCQLRIIWSILSIT